VTVNAHGSCICGLHAIGARNLATLCGYHCDKVRDGYPIGSHSWNMGRYGGRFGKREPRARVGLEEVGLREVLGDSTQGGAAGSLGRQYAGWAAGPWVVPSVKTRLLIMKTARSHMASTPAPQTQRPSTSLAISRPATCHYAPNQSVRDGGGGGWGPGNSTT